MQKGSDGSTTLCIRLPKEIKAEFETVCAKMGLSMSGAITLFATQTINEQRIPFMISVGNYHSGK